MRLLFVKDALAFPRSSGHDVHCYSMMRALAAAGSVISLATVSPPSAAALADCGVERVFSLEEPSGGEGTPAIPLTPLQERFRNFWGVPESRIRSVSRAAAAAGAEAVIAVGLNVLPYLAGAPNALRVWYAADEWAWHHWSLVRISQPSTWGNLKAAVVKGIYERAYAPLLHRVWVVSDADRRAMRWVAGVRRIDVLPNGVDAAWFAPPHSERPTPRSCVFWGRLDFEPNIQALQWFCRRVWPRLRDAAPDARLSVFGFMPGREVRSLAGRDGITLTPDLPDLRAEIVRHSAVVLPFVSGGGIKNKLLEAAALAMPIVCTPRACGGLRSRPPVVAVRRPGAWVGAILELWRDEERRRALGSAARDWVLRNHTWSSVAREAMTGLADGGVGVA